MVMFGARALRLLSLVFLWSNLSVDGGRLVVTFSGSAACNNGQMIGTDGYTAHHARSPEHAHFDVNGDVGTVPVDAAELALSCVARGLAVLVLAAERLLELRKHGSRCRDSAATQDS